MDPTEESQNLESLALQSIYPDEFIEVPPRKAWKRKSWKVRVARSLFLEISSTELQL